MVYLLSAIYPEKADLQRLVYLDYAAIYSADLGGPPSLHTPVPLRGAEYASRRSVIEEGLYIMASRSFVNVSAEPRGIMYGLGENGPALVNILGGDYVRQLSKRCKWVAQTFSKISDEELGQIFRERGILWGAEFVGMKKIVGQR
jgi:hypothetical protein